MTAAAPADRVPVRASVLVGAAAFALCLALAPAFPGDGDAGEFTLALALAGVPHPTGYPLYTLLGHAWVVALHALGMGWAHAANAWSAAGAGVAVGLLHALVARLVPGGPGATRTGRALLAAVPALLLLLNPAFLREATVAEVTSWQVAVVAGMALAAHRVLAALDAGLDEGTLARRAFVMGLAGGAGLAHHATSVFFLVPIVATIVLSRVRTGRLRFTTTLAAWAGLALPLLADLHVAWRAAHPAAFQWPLLQPTVASVLGHVTGSVYGAYFGGFAPRPEEARLIRYAIAPLAVPGFALGVFAFVRDRGGARRALLGALLAGALLQAGFVLVYGVPDSVPYLLPVLAVALAGLGVAAAPVAARLRGAFALVALALAVAVYGALGLSWLGAHHRRIGLVARTIEERWRALPFERGIVLWNSDHYTQLVILQRLAGVKPGIVVDDPATLTWTPARRAFERRTGVDPLAGLALTDESQLGEIVPNVARQARVPVVDFATWRP